MNRNIVVTWPKTKPLEVYLGTLRRAFLKGLVINYRVRHLPTWDDATLEHDVLGWPFGVERPHCYHVHDGAVRGWTEVLYGCHRHDGEVDGWPAGLYIVRSPEWHPVDPTPMAGFRGWRWYG